jgi:hypothetical protein
MADSDFTYRLNEQTGRWDVIGRSPDGSEEVVLCSYGTPDEASDHVARLTGKPLPIPPG